MTRRTWLLVICVVATLNGLFFIWYQRPDWQTQWSDQDGYRRLGEVLATTGKFTRFPDASRFVPEVIRTPVYPLFVATIYRIAGVSQLAVALAQTVLFVLICLLVFAMARRVAGERVATIAAVLTAVFPTIPYFGALVMTEVWTTFLFTAAIWISVRAIDEPSPRTYALLGFLLGVSTLSRPVFVLYPFALGAVLLVAMPLSGVRVRRALAGVAVMIAVFAVTMVPWLAYNYVNLGRMTLSPAGGIGRGLWEGSWQATWSGRVQNELTHLADDIDDRRELDARVEAVARRESADPAPMLAYVHQWEDIRLIWTRPTDPVERAFARVKADQEYERVAIGNLKRDSASHLAKRLARGVFVLWAGDIPFRYSDINRLPPALIRTCWTIAAALFALAILGIAALWRSGRVREAWLLGTPIAYITAVHFPLLTEARQSLPAKPDMLLLTTVGALFLAGRLFAGEPQVHEREHL